MLRTVDSETGPGLQLLMLSQSSVPHCTPVGGPVSVLVRQDGQHTPAGLILVSTNDHGGL